MKNYSGGTAGIGWEFEASKCKLLHIEWISNKILLYRTGNYIQYPMINYNGKEYKKEHIHISNWITFLYIGN